METDQLIRHIADRALPVSRLSPPWAALWLAPSLLYVSAVATVHLLGSSLPGPVDLRLLVEETAILATAATAAIASFSSVVPGT